MDSGNRSVALGSALPLSSPSCRSRKEDSPRRHEGHEEKSIAALAAPANETAAATGSLLSFHLNAEAAETQRRAEKTRTESSCKRGGDTRTEDATRTGSDPFPLSLFVLFVSSWWPDSSTFSTRRPTTDPAAVNASTFRTSGLFSAALCASALSAFHFFSSPTGYVSGLRRLTLVDSVGSS